MKRLIASNNWHLFDRLLLVRHNSIDSQFSKYFAAIISPVSSADPAHLDVIICESFVGQLDPDKVESTVLSVFQYDRYCESTFKAGFEVQCARRANTPYLDPVFGHLDFDEEFRLISGKPFPYTAGVSI